MGALRKAGVWLGLVEDDDEHEYDEPAYDKGYSSGYRDRGGRRGDRAEDRYSRDGGRYNDDFEDDDDLDEAPSVPRTRMATDRSGSARLEAARESARAEATRLNVEARLEAARAERATVRPITRPLTAAPATASATGGATAVRDNLALAPQVQPQQRVAATAEDDRRPQITTLHPTTYNEARQIGERFRDGTPVIMNLTEMDEADAKRLVDFAAGLAFGLRGTIERVTNRVFLLSPANVQVTAEDKAKIAEGGYLNQS
ncbi:cell division protein SepF [Catellatospora coxensis]|uniref:Cell division protein SepF n=1 Tax=Catellatospora coxensis TaxID=310354 RepID=A0A8J3KM43_9ACTN|nr:cell division protein SepF [Catellatospora coxensis]GIG03530.1 cell division protein SepF 2 [Catellatospora coxensis]